jgi:hypothetical protein
MTCTQSTTYECPAGLRYHNGAAALWVRSPRTGHTAIVPAGKFPSLPGRVVGRVTQAASVGRRLVRFTRDELVAIAAAAKTEAVPEPVAPVVEPAPEACVRRSFWGTPAMSRVRPAEPVVSHLPAIIGTEGIHNHPYLCITLPDRHVTFRPHDWPRLPTGTVERVKAAAGKRVAFSDVEVSAILAAREAVDRAIAGNTGVARSCRSRKGH